ncbi:Transcriptional regulator MntR [Stieleria bergensis]|uniref:Transcriptional regulator MntR n=1 Tax=Stieleria bergensis TaxID=2528025 RepID=A0A517T0N0_9BACT|nr:MAG: transcriptional regulator MntR [Rhodopirellula sp. TMED11]QDT61912.1 Transcriptional regulator MntR [Planctomycetes bacterium SV_7m_r]
MAEAFSRTRADHASETAEDYVEAIAAQIQRTGICRSADLAEFFSVTHATVNNTVARLVRDGYAKTEPYRPIELTPEGRRLAEHCEQRHQVVKAFLLAMGVSEKVAAIDSEGIEHHVSQETLKAMKQVLKDGWPTK